MVVAPRRYRGGNWAGSRALLMQQVRRDLSFWHSNLLGPVLQAVILALVFTLAAGDRFGLRAAAGINEAETILAFVLPGLLTIAIASRSFESLAFALVFDRMERIIDNVLGAPLSAGEIVTAYALQAVFVALMTLATVYPALMLMGAPWPAHPLGLIAVTALAGAAVGLAGLVAGLTSDKWDQMQAKDTFILTPLTYLSGGFFALSALPGPLQAALVVNPLFHVTDALRWAVSGQGHGDLAISLAVMAATALGFGAWAGWAFVTGWRLKA
jgi:ABC-2 type transport system permease protein